ncbi:hypothetical protein F7230_01215 [Corynebacterium sp. 320]|uniref:Rv2732c family membrane protein n=1 Tax=Corynebacterium TaxID=1716 RepID=UPI00125CC49B|nr:MULTISPECIES: hypothetical protein [Corynebacterium]KAB1503764.1 hypothetical protein F7230_01215 [Corynebacterium sp. 320]KAB1553136.1 hypothetical protein F7233_05375 [Corynebacterium sp. 321]KAB1553646.1 hypothetical protein F7232_01210 [Corynebacterium sp. 319]KAB3527900.1 hypothetical protein F8354_01215 [Corynebacterium sp. 250]KAB3540611.1 hypothetical protein F8390_05120 [Corynebacterium sp. 366]
MTKKRTQKTPTYRTIDEALETYKDDLAGAEKKLNRDINYTAFLPAMACGLLAVFLAFFLPHSGDVHGYDVLFDTSVARQFATTNPERIYSWLALTGGVLLTLATIFTRDWIVAWANWAVAGVGWFYSIIAIWMRQSRPTAPVNDPLLYGDGPSYGLILALLGMTTLFATLSVLLFRRSPLQKAIARARREEASKDEEALLKQQRLRTGLKPHAQAEIVDDRRQRVRQRREQTGD